MVVLGRFTTTPEAEDAAGAVNVRFHDIGGRDSAAIIALVEQERTALGGSQPGAWKPWFPVIDYDRCTNCMQCLSFCLFGVYGVDDQQRIQVQNNDNCKTNCPACSRVCPEAAIMFEWFDRVGYSADIGGLRREFPEVNWTDFAAWAKGVDWRAIEQGQAAAAV